jgi:hypothetical protein
MAGGYETTDERANVPGYGGWINGRGNPGMDMLRLYGILYEFWTARQWWSMEPLRGVGPDSVPCLGVSGSEYVFYLAHGESIRVVLPESGYRAQWFNPRLGAYSDAGVARNADWTFPSAPDSQDWILLVDAPRAKR